MAAVEEACKLEEVDDYERVRAEELLRGYHFRWVTEQDAKIETVSVETEFSIPFETEGGDYVLAGKFDALCKIDGRLFVGEHKTSSEDITPGSEYWQRVGTLDTQISTYIRAAKALSIGSIHGCLYDVIFRPDARVRAIPILDSDGVKVVLDVHGRRVHVKSGKKWRETADKAEGYTLQTRDETPDEYRLRLRNAIAEDPEGYYQRATIVRTEWDEQESDLDLRHTALLMATSERCGWHPRNPKACKQYGSVCQYLPVCSGTAELTDPIRYRKLTVIHEELSAATGG